MSIFDKHLLPILLLAVKTVEPFQDDMLSGLAIRTRNIVDVKAAANLAMVSHLARRVSSKRAGIDDVALAEFVKTAKGNYRICNALRNSLFLGFGS
jgi:hypothetical protein